MTFTTKRGSKSFGEHNGTKPTDGPIESKMALYIAKSISHTGKSVRNWKPSQISDTSYVVSCFLIKVSYILGSKVAKSRIHQVTRSIGELSGSLGHCEAIAILQWVDGHTSFLENVWVFLIISFFDSFLEGKPAASMRMLQIFGNFRCCHPLKPKWAWQNPMVRDRASWMLDLLPPFPRNRRGKWGLEDRTMNVVYCV